MAGNLPDDVPDEFLGPSPQAEWARDAAGVMPASGDLPDTVHADPAVAIPSWRPARRGDTPGQLAPKLHGDPPEGQQPRVCDALCWDVEEDRDRVAAELVTMREVAQGNKRHVAYLTEENERLRAEVARVRAQVAEEIARAIEARPYRQYASPARDPAGRIVGGYRPGSSSTYADAARIAREHVVAPAESVVGDPPDPVGNEQHRRLPTRPMFPQDEWDPQCACGGDWPCSKAVGALPEEST